MCFCPYICFTVVLDNVVRVRTAFCLTLSGRYIFADWFHPISSDETEFAD